MAQKKTTPAQAQKQVEQQKSETTAPAPGNVRQPAATDKPEARKTAKKDKTTAAKDATKTDDANKEEESNAKDPMSSKTFSGLKWRSIGPATTSGRVLDFAVNPKNRAQYYVATQGGLFKTLNSGTTWISLFDGEGSYSIGCVTLDPNDSNVVWVGTGERNSQRSVSYGDGVYRSDDGGKSWKNVGLKKSEHIGKIVVDPRNSNVVFVAAQGPLWSAGGDRGLYKTADAGKTWKQVLKISENTGVTDVAYDFNNPDIMYAASYQRRRHVFTMINGGPESAIYKSTDGGETWAKLKNGLPTDEMGKIGLAVSSADSNIVYAYIEAANGKGGFFRSIDKGASWEKRNPFDATAQYYAYIWADPKNPDKLYYPNFHVMMSSDGGKTLVPLPSKTRHVDNHAIWIDPKDTNYMLVGGDGGVYETFDGGQNWAYKSNLPVTQFYDVTVDNSQPFYFVYGGTQDNYSLGGPSRTRNASGIVNSDWFVTQGGDGFRSQVDPVDPNIVYAEAQYGALVRFDRRTGEGVGIQPVEGKGEEPLRWNWDSPILISPHQHTRLYFAANKLFRSDDRGDSWKAISPDLSRQIDRNKLPVMGKVWGADAVAKNASTSFYGNIVALTESPKREGLLYVGTDDGLIHVTEDAGAHWAKYEKFPGVPEMTYVSRLAGSHHDVGTVYASFENHKNGDFKPYLLKSTDNGKTWTSIAGNLPENGPVLAFAEDTVNPNLLFAGTEYGAFFTNDGGKKWIQLKGGLPTIAVRDIVVHPREGDLVIATFGRGFYVMDDITLLRQVKAETLQQNVAMFPVKDTMMFMEAFPIGGRGKGYQGDNFFTAENPPYGATFTYYLKDKLKSKKDKRQESEKEAAKKNEAVTYPTNDELRAEAEEEAPYMFFTVLDAQGKPIRRLSAPGKDGINRVAWDFRYPNPALRPEVALSEGDEDWPSDRSIGPLVLPGKYAVTLSQKVDGVVTDLTQPVWFNVYAEGTSTMKLEDRLALNEFQQKVSRLHRAVNGAGKTVDDVRSRVKQIKRALNEVPWADRGLSQRADKIEAQLNLIQRKLRGDNALRARNENVATSIQERVGGVMGDTRMIIQRPTGTHMQSYAVAAQEFKEQLAALRTLVDGELTPLEKDMETAGAPWTPGRIPTWQEE
ncbi:MAG TPA: glycosyl hydrolase [Clostridia bacterium]|nr:glycosyl hydrolase [Clostridia bacterium]